MTSYLTTAREFIVQDVKPIVKEKRRLLVTVEQDLIYRASKENG